MIKIIALDIGGVIAYQDDSQLNGHEKFLLKIYLSHGYSKLKLQKENRELSLEIENEIGNIYSKLYILTEETLSCLERLRKKGYSLSLWTNNRPAINSWIQTTGLDHYIPTVLICNSCNMPNGINKPDTRFYTYALKQIKALPQQVLFIDDSIQNVESAEKIGIPSLNYSCKNHNLQESINKKIKMIRRNDL